MNDATYKSTIVNLRSQAKRQRENGNEERAKSLEAEAADMEAKQAAPKDQPKKP